MKVQLTKNRSLLHDELHLLSSYLLPLLLLFSSLLFHSQHFYLVISFHFILSITTLQVHFHGDGTHVLLLNLLDLLLPLFRRITSLFDHSWTLFQINRFFKPEVRSQNQFVHVQGTFNSFTNDSNTQLRHDILAQGVSINSEVIQRQRIESKFTIADYLVVVELNSLILYLL